MIERITACFGGALSGPNCRTHCKTPDESYFAMVPSQLVPVNLSSKRPLLVPPTKTFPDKSTVMDALSKDLEIAPSCAKN